MTGEFGEQGPQRRLVIGQRSVRQQLPSPVQRDRVMGLPGHVDAAEDLDGDAASDPKIVGVRQLTSSSQPSRPATDDAPAATLRAGLRTAARSLSAVTNALRSR
jgi:hypothetical protein